MSTFTTIKMTAHTTTLTFFAITVLHLAAALRPVDSNPCYRSCEFSTPMQCIYNFTIDWFYTLSGQQCGECPSSASNCSNLGCVPMDGVHRAVNLINRVFPAPSIQICSSDEVVINVTNKMSNGEGTSIHWHGIFMNGSQYMDGIAMVTQCPISSPGNFEYRFIPYEAGTHWFHSHSGMQRGDGIMGSFIVREGSQTNPHWSLYDKDIAEHVIFLNDWYHQTLVSVYEQTTWGDAPFVNSILINGKGIFENSSPPHPPVEIFTVDKDIRYRFRVISGATSFCNMQFSIQNHSLVMIGSDGGSFQPQVVDYFRISSGERYDFILTANQPIGNYEIHIIGLPCTNVLGTSTKQIAYLHYYNASDIPSTEVTLPDIPIFGDENTWWQVFPGKSLADINSVDTRYKSTDTAEETQYYIQVGVTRRIDPSTQSLRAYPQLNNISFYFPTSPLLTQYSELPKHIFCSDSDFKPDECDGDTVCACVHTITLKLDQQMELILVNADVKLPILHPMHLHGMQFKVVAMDKIEGATIEKVRELDRQGLIKRNNDGPMKDVVIVPNGGYTIIQIHAWNPGWWIFHCHVEFHLEEGMALVFHIGQPGELPPIPKSFPRCSTWSGDVTTDNSASQSSKTHNYDQVSNSVSPLYWTIPLALIIGLAAGMYIGGSCVMTRRSTNRDPTLLYGATDY